MAASSFVAPPPRVRRARLIGWLLLGAVAVGGGVSVGAHPPPRPLAAAAAVAARGAVSVPAVGRIFGGTVTPIGEEPFFLAHFTAPDTPSTLQCTGVLITPRHVLTLASCPIVTGWTVRLGTPTAGSGGQTFLVSRVAIPPYRDAEAVPLADNIAVVTFTAEPIWSADRLATFRIVPVALDGGRGVGGGRGNDASAGPPPPPGGLDSRIWGWGTPSARRDDPLRPEGGTVLRSAAAVVVEAEACSALFEQAGGTRPYDVYCAKSVGQGPCVGDRGAGLVSNVGGDAGGRPFVHGLYSVSWSSAEFRCVKSFPQGYTAVRTHAAWIRSAVEPQRAQFLTL